MLDRDVARSRRSVAAGSREKQGVQRPGDARHATEPFGLLHLPTRRASTRETRARRPADLDPSGLCVCCRGFLSEEKLATELRGPDGSYFEHREGKAQFLATPAPGSSSPPSLCRAPSCSCPCSTTVSHRATGRSGNRSGLRAGTTNGGASGRTNAPGGTVTRMTTAAERGDAGGIGRGLPRDGFAKALLIGDGSNMIRTGSRVAITRSLGISVD